MLPGSLGGVVPVPGVGGPWLTPPTLGLPSLPLGASLPPGMAPGGGSPGSGEGFDAAGIIGFSASVAPVPLGGTPSSPLWPQAAASANANPDPHPTTPRQPNCFLVIKKSSASAFVQRLPECGSRRAR